MADLSLITQSVLSAIQEVSPAPADEIASVALRAMVEELVKDDPSFKTIDEELLVRRERIRMLRTIITTAYELEKRALARIMDGLKPHDLPYMTGLPESDCERIWAVYTALAEQQGEGPSDEEILQIAGHTACTDQHPITPPIELVRKWAQVNGEKDLERFWLHISVQAARWGANQELEACCKWLHWQNLATHTDLIPSLRSARRPSPPSLKKQALEDLDRAKEIELQLSVTVCGPMGSETEPCASSWEVAKLIAGLEQRVAELEKKKTDHPITPPPELAMSSDYDILSQLTDEERKKGQDMLAVPWQAEDIIKKPSMGDRSLIPSRPLLWWLLLEAFANRAKELGLSWTCRDSIAAEIRALRDWLVPEEPEAPAGDGEPWPQSYQQRSDAMWEQRQQLRAILTAEAERAERGE